MASDGESDDEWDCVYGGEVQKKQILIMAGGGSHAWNYEIHEDGTLYITRYGGSVEEQRGMKLMLSHKNNVEQVKMVSLDYEPQDTENEIDYHSMMCESEVFDARFQR